MRDELAKVITMTASHRPAYTRQVLQALSQCDGIENYLMLPCIEPGDEEVRALFESVAFAQCDLVVNRERLGCGANTLFAVERGFQSSSFVIHIEDDTVPAADALAFFEYCRNAYRGDHEVFTVGGYASAPDAERQRAAPGDEDFRAIRRYKWFTPWGWATWRDRFEEMRHGWNSRNWDTNLNHVLRRQRCEVAPVLSRFQNIGADGGTHVPSAEWHRDNQHLKVWAGAFSMRAGCDWHESAAADRGARIDTESALRRIRTDANEQAARDLTPENAAEIAADVLASIPAYPAGRYSGRGIVICAGGAKYLTCAWVLIRTLRHLGCELPIEIWHLGEEEKDPHWIELVKPFGVESVDAHEVRNEHPHPKLGGWQCKAYAILHTRFREVLLLDADNVPTVDPTFLFEIPEYRGTGALFWPDMPSMAADHPAWKVFDVAYRQEREQESGQIVVDKQRCWRALNLCNWYNEQSDFFYQFIYGDKDTFRFAWHRAGRPFAMAPPHQPAPMGIYQFDFAGNILFQHRIHDKWRLSGNQRILGFQHEEKCRGLVDELRRRWQALSRITDKASAADWRRTKALEDTHFEMIRVGQNRWPIQLAPSGCVGVGWSPSTFLWWIEEGRLVLAGDDGRVTCRLAERRDGAWEGGSLRNPSIMFRLLPRPCVEMEAKQLATT